MISPTEAQFQREIIDALVKQHSYTELPDSAYNQNLALVPSELYAFLQDTDAKAFEKVTDKSDFLKRLTNALRDHGALHVWRRGFEYKQHTFRIVAWRPKDQSSRADAARVNYKKNRFSVIQELHYDVDQAKNNRLDLVLFLNGLPLLTVELKNPFTGQGAKKAVTQYRCDRDPNAPLFQFSRRALVHFAVDKFWAYMTTRLRGQETTFLPFNKGRDGGEGNPPVPGKHPTHYLWEQSWAPDTLLDILESYATIELPDTTPENKGASERTMREAGTLIFPRYHQLDCVDYLLRRVDKKGAGKPALIQHSTGSGKSYTMAWLAHRLSNHFHQGERVFGSVLLVTDRVQLDDQLRKLVKSIGIHDKVYTARTTKGLGQALESGEKIITTTLHKFFHLLQKTPPKSLSQNFAVIIDEAHSSYGSTLQESLEKVLSNVSKAGVKLSYFAFTATPHGKTLQIFGKGPKKKKRPHHVYGMRQAREEGFIVDVLRNIVSYTELGKVSTRVPKLWMRPGQSVGQVVAAMEKPILAKSAVILDHFRTQVQSKLAGQARAMVLAPNVTAGIRYFRALNALIDQDQAGGSDKLEVLIAFSGSHVDPDDPSQPRLTEGSLNPKGEQDLDIARRLRSTARILVAIDKFQTGFNEPRLMALYVDKPVKGVRIIQTFSRLNRPFRGLKGPTPDTLPYVVDFANDPAALIKAFKDADKGLQKDYRYVNQAYIEQLVDSLRSLITPELQEEYLAIRVAMVQGELTSSGPHSDFFAKLLAQYKGLEPDPRAILRVDLGRFLQSWPLALLVLQGVYLRGSERVRERNTLFRLAKELLVVIREDSAPDKQEGQQLTEDLISLEEHALLVDRWEPPSESEVGDKQDGEEAPPMDYSPSTGKDPELVYLEQLVARYNKMTGALTGKPKQVAQLRQAMVELLGGIRTQVCSNPEIANARKHNDLQGFTTSFFLPAFEDALDAAHEAADPHQKHFLQFIEDECANDVEHFARECFEGHAEA